MIIFSAQLNEPHERHFFRNLKQKEGDPLKGKEAKAKCCRCDREGHFSRNSCCPARKAECQRCHKIRHFAKAFKTKTGTRKKHFLDEMCQTKEDRM